MSKIKPSTQEFENWLVGRPDVIKKLAVALPPWERYRLKPTGQHCTLHSYSEDKTVTIDVDGHDSEVLDVGYRVLNIRVFGINPDDLEIIQQCQRQNQITKC